MTPGFLTEDELETFEGFLRYQAVDAAKATADELAMWRDMFVESRAVAGATPALEINLRSEPGVKRYAVAVREDGQLWLILWVKRNPKGHFFVMIPRGKGRWNPHTSYHLDGTFHMKSHNRAILPKKCQPLTSAFRGNESLGVYGGHFPKSVGAVCDPKAFDGIVEVAPNVLGPRDGTVVVDLVEPGCEPMPWPVPAAQKVIFRDVVPWVVIRIVPSD